MNYDKETSTAADLDRAWAALAAVTTYPRWTASMSTVDPLDDPALKVGHRFRIKQPGFPPVVWRVSEVREGESFSWETKAPGLHTVGIHRLNRNPDGTTRISLELRQSGPLAGLMAMLTATKTRRFMELEAAGVKAAAEAARPSDAAA